jgi:hypothetical protein
MRASTTSPVGNCVTLMTQSMPWRALSGRTQNC